MTRYLHLPAIQGNATVIQGQSDNDNAHLFVTAWLLRLGERARIMQSDARLMTAAREHATWLAQRQGEEMQQSTHIGKGGTSPNERLIASGYKPPSFWKIVGKNCEACAVHHDGPVQAFELMLTSPAHRQLVMGERVNDWFWHEHTVWGLGNAGPFYVLVVCPPEGSQG